MVSLLVRRNGKRTKIVGDYFVNGQPRKAILWRTDTGDDRIKTVPLSGGSREGLDIIRPRDEPPKVHVDHLDYQGRTVFHAYPKEYGVGSMSVGSPSVSFRNSGAVKTLVALLDPSAPLTNISVRYGPGTVWLASTRPSEVAFVNIYVE